MLGLYHALGPDIDTVYVGSYDWRGEPCRDQRLTSGLREICVPLSNEHHTEAEKLARDIGKVVIDAAFSKQALLSPQWMAEARKWIEWADVVIFEHPWAYTPLKPHVRPDQTLVYDAQNVESFLKAESLGFDGAAEDLVKEVIRNEYDLLVEADLVICCSEEDASQFSQMFEISESRIRIAPNGAFTRSAVGSITSRRAAARADINPGDTRPVAVFMGSQYGPNAEAARFIVTGLAPAQPGIHFVLIGSVADALHDLTLPSNVTLTGVVSGEDRDAWLLRADVALNPMGAGSGTNVKMFDYLASGLPVLTTAIGARGICDHSTAPMFLRLAPQGKFAEILPSFIAEQGDEAAHAEAWSFVNRRFSWEGISAETGRVLAEVHALKRVFPEGRKTVLLLSTWNIRCGIGEHSTYLADGLRQCGWEVVVYGNRLEGHAPVGFELDLQYPVARGWTWDDRTWCNSGLDQRRYRQVLDHVRPACVIVQHHTAYMPAYDYELAVSIARESGASVVIEMHDARNLADETARALVTAGASLVAHDESERSEFPAEIAAQMTIINHPVYTPKLGDWQVTEHDSSAPIISGFGFLRPYKGVHIAIEAMSLIRRKFPAARYKGWHAFYPGLESKRYYQECMSLARTLGIDDAIFIDTDFKPIDEVISGLASTSLVLLPYAPSVEGASGAANIAIAAGRPVVVSKSDIFRPLADVCAIAREHEAGSYAKEIISLLQDSPRLRAYTEISRRWANENSYFAAARHMLEAKSKSDPVIQK